MAQFDSHVNLLSGTIKIAPLPAVSGATIVLHDGEGMRFRPNMPVTLSNPHVDVLFDNTEIGYVTAVDGDTLTVDRAQEGTAAQPITAGWKVSGSVTAKSLTDVEGALVGKVDAAELAPIATTGSYTDLTDKPVIPSPYTDAQAAAAAPVQSVAGKTGTVALTKADVGLGNVNNTADSDKPVSTAQAAAIQQAQQAAKAYAVAMAVALG